MASIQTSDLIYRLPQLSNDTTSNGGRMTKNVMGTGVGNIMPTLEMDERTAGITRYRKRYLHVSISDNTAYMNVSAYIAMPTREDDRVALFLGTQIDTQDDITGTERKYTCGFLNANVTAGATQITVAVESASDNGFAIGDQIKIFHTQWSTPLSKWVDLTVERKTIQNVSAAGNILTITLDSALANSFNKVESWSGTPLQLTEYTAVASFAPVGNVVATASDFVITSASGNYDINNYPIILSNRGCIQQNWTLTFSSSTVIVATGDTLVGTFGGNTSSGISPTNTDFSMPYFTLVSGGFSGSWSAGDTIEFTTNPASIPLWFKQVVPPNTDSFSANRWMIGIEGESG
jgi:hypothetical protein